MAAFIFIITYIGVALGRIPGLVIDRVGIALLGAIAMVGFGIVTLDGAIHAIDFPTILLLYALMIISAQLRLGGFYTWVATLITGFMNRPRLFLFICMLASAVLSAVLANDIVCFAFTPVLVLSSLRAGLNPAPFLIGLAVSSNIGSASTIIGNPQNMLIGQVGRLDFQDFFLWCTPPSIIGLLGSYLIILLVNRAKMQKNGNDAKIDVEETWPVFNRWQTTKGLIATGILLLMFFTSFPREVSALFVAGMLLCSRKMKTRELFSLIDWHLIVLFCSLFIVIHGISQGTYPSRIVNQLNTNGFELQNLFILSGVSTLLSNVFSNVPATMLLIQFLDRVNPVAWYVLAVSSTFAGNLIIIGSIANLIVIEQASHYGVKISFKEHAVNGVPVTFFTLIVLFIWIMLTGPFN